MTGKKRVLWVNPSFLSYRIPVYEALSRLLGDNFYLLYSEKRVPENVRTRISQALGTRARALKEEKIIRLGRSGNFANQGLSIPIQKDLYRAIQEVQPDIIISEGFFQWTLYAVWYTRFRNVPLYVAYERTAYTERNCPPWRERYRSLLDNFVQGYLVNGTLTKAYLREKLGVSPQKPIQEGVMAADSDLLRTQKEGVSPQQRQARRCALWSSKGDKSSEKGLAYLYVGQIIDRKGVKELLEGWKQHARAFPDDLLILAGSGDMEEGLQASYSTLPQVYWTGEVAYEEIYQYYAVADVFVMPTLEDNWSLVVPEAMACDLPIICSTYNGCYPELVTPCTGWLFDPLQTDTLVEALAKAHEADLPQMGRAAAALEANYNPARAAQRIHHLISHGKSE
ncbi:MAG: glycosyltransferase family 4 protein [Nitritalea sp.]